MCTWVSDTDSSHSRHRKAIVQEAEERELKLWDAKGFEAITGQGIKAVVNDQNVLVGNRKQMEEENISLREGDTDHLAEKGKTPIYIAADGKLLGVIAAAMSLSSVSVVTKCTKTEEGQNKIM